MALLWECDTTQRNLPNKLQLSYNKGVALFCFLSLFCREFLMAQAIVDPEQLRQFAALLKRYSQTVRDSTTTLNQSLSRLSESWRDQEHRKFSDEFEEQIKLVSKLLEMSDKHIPYLVKKAEIIEQYLQR